MSFDLVKNRKIGYDMSAQTNTGPDASAIIGKMTPGAAGRRAKLSYKLRAKRPAGKEVRCA